MAYDEQLCGFSCFLFSHVDEELGHQESSKSLLQAWLLEGNEDAPETHTIINTQRGQREPQVVYQPGSPFHTLTTWNSDSLTTVTGRHTSAWSPIPGTTQLPFPRAGQRSPRAGRAPTQMLWSTESVGALHSTIEGSRCRPRVGRLPGVDRHGFEFYTNLLATSPYFSSLSGE